MKAALTYDGVVTAVERAMTDLGRGAAADAPRVRANVDGVAMSALAAVWPGAGVCGGKLYPTVGGVFTFTVLLHDLAGRLLAVIQADALTRLRTAAAAGIAIRRMATRPVEIVTVVGLGRQLDGMLMMLASESWPLREVRLVGRRPDRIAAAVRAATERGLPAVGYTDADAAAHACDVIVTITSSPEPVFAGESPGSGTLVCALGATKPSRREIGSSTVARAAVVVDSLAGARVECGDLIGAAADNEFDWSRAQSLPILLATGATPVEVDRDLVLFESQGIALQDLAAGWAVLSQLDVL